MFQLSKIIGFFSLVVLGLNTSASSISDCIYKVKVNKVTKKAVSFKVVSLDKSLGNNKCLYKKGQSSSLELKKVNTDKLTLKAGKNFILRAMKYQGKGHKGILVTGEKYYFYKL